MNVKKEPYSLLDNSRFYILAFSIILSVTIFAWLRLSVDSDQLFLIRTQQCYGLICLLFWYVALIVSPLGHVVGKHRMKRVEFARRAIGVSAFYFAALHAAIALFGQLGGVGQIQYLPELFKWSLAGGAFALVVLGSMAATSFDRVIRFMTFRKWKWLHRLGYIAGVLVILHIWTIGTHMAYVEMQLAGYGALVILIGLELFRVVKALSGNYLKFDAIERAVLWLTLWAVAAVLLLAMPWYVQNYHSRHVDHGGHGQVEQ